MARSGGASGDPWSTDAGVQARRWHVFAAVGAGAAYSAVWLVLNQPDVHLSQFFLPASWVIAGVAALTAPPTRRLARAVPWLMAGFVALGASRLVAIAGLAMTGDEPLGSNVSGVIVFAMAILFLGGGWLSIARLTVPSRRLAQGVLDQIPPPAATWRQPRTVAVEMRDGRVIELTMLQGGYIARPRGTDPGQVVGVAHD